MDGQLQEKVGVVVVHGVGANHEGWINDSVVAELEKWAAYESVGGLARKDGGNELLIVAQAADGHIVIALGCDGDFGSFCQAADLGPLTESGEFSTRAARIRNRDELSDRIE